MPIRNLLLACVVAGFIAGCGSGGSGGGGSGDSTGTGSTPTGALNEYVVAPATTDAAIDNWLDDHYAYRDTRVTARNRLLVHLPGSYGTPVNSRKYLREIAAAGDHVIGLRYPNTWEVTDLCATATDLSCYENVRREIIDGTDRSALVAVNAANSIINRLVKLLVYLHAHFPNEGWGQYLSNGAPNWARIGFSGHSQGAGHAAVIGKHYALDRVLMFAAPGDGNSNGIAPWQDRNHLTPTGNYYGFNHDRDAWPMKQLVWTLIGLADYGAPISVDSVASPYSDSHMLHTDALPATGTYNDAHGAVITDEKTPLALDGTPLYAPVWRYLCCR
jgi:hypothetical protein